MSSKGSILPSHNSCILWLELGQSSHLGYIHNTSLRLSVFLFSVDISAPLSQDWLHAQQRPARTFVHTRHLHLRGAFIRALYFWLP